VCVRVFVFIETESMHLGYDNVTHYALQYVAVCWSVWQCVVVLQCVAAYYALQYVAVCWSVWQCVVVCYSVLQRAVAC